MYVPLQVALPNMLTPDSDFYDALIGVHFALVEKLVRPLSLLISHELTIL